MAVSCGVVTIDEMFVLITVVDQGEDVVRTGCKRSREDLGSCCRLNELPAIAPNTIQSGAVFWPSSWRSKLCTCRSCQVRPALATLAEAAMTSPRSCPCVQENLSAAGLSFLLDESDTVLAYENKGKTSEEARQHDPLMSALDRLNRVQQLEIIHGTPQ